ncbi:MAG: hypothetical protein JXQ85_00605 [Cognatishimia sp.]
MKELEGLLGAEDSDNIKTKAMEEIAIRLSQSEKLLAQLQWPELRKVCASIGKISDQIGMTSLVEVSALVTDSIDNNDAPAMAATHFRLLRVGDRSLTEFWDQQDMSG